MNKRESERDKGKSRQKDEGGERAERGGGGGGRLVS